MSISLVARQGRAPPQDELMSPADQCNSSEELDIAKSAANWGCDMSGLEALLEQIYRGLQIQPRSFQGLKQLPGLHSGHAGLEDQQGCAECRLLIYCYLQVLDSSLATSFSPGAVALKLLARCHTTRICTFPRMLALNGSAAKQLLHVHSSSSFIHAT